MAFAAHILRIECRTTSALALPEFTGSALRGSLLGALRPLFCPDAGRSECAPCPHADTCPLTQVIATIAADNSRGEEAARPYVIRPVVARSRALEAGETFQFGLSLIGDAIVAFPYVLQGLLAMGEAGFGLRQRAPGRFAVARVIASNPYIAAEQTVYEAGRRTVYAPSLPVRQEQISNYAATLSPSEVCLELKSPLRLVANGTLAHHPGMETIVRRLLRRLTDLHAGSGAGQLQADFAGLVQAAASARLLSEETEWLDLESWSGRSGRRSPIGGLVGRLRFGGDLAPVYPYLGWLPVVGLGKDVTKGNGWIELGT
jgi:hypothetical protein